ncbi:hypothetical protein [Bradyrhizobium sp. Ash2021]|uniref:hypothetical protein n=1 Tax=Bradyrhizobium sp. Ash2021 TaxID=2954771 RepID=UPI0028165747|nr:hypothetical protein [Bradyrhizobium sp. Ash2021]WMT72129.1 hypothetical protein NL528_29295 [Bradyrhizobium sp. Ash2021]
MGRFAAAADEDERVDNSGRGASETGLGKPLVIETEYAAKEIAEFGVPVYNRCGEWKGVKDHGKAARV